MKGKELPRKLNLLEIFCIASGAMISSGIFILPGIAHSRAGPAVIVSYFLAGVLAMIGVLSQAELVSAMPRAGGTYFYVTRSMGSGVGTVDGLLTWFSLSLKSAFALVGMAAFTRLLIGLNIQTIAIVLCVFFIILNIIGIKEAGKTQVGMVMILFGILITYVALGLPEVNVEYFRDFASKGIPAVFSTAGFVFVSFGGILKIASLAEEVEEPGRIIPLGMILALILVSILYFLVIFVTSGVLGAHRLDNSLTPLSDAAGVFMGLRGQIILGLGAIMAFISTANAGIMSASRYPLALSRDGLLPDFLRKVSDRFETPYISILLTGTVMIIALFFKIDILVEAASTVLIMTYLFSSIAVIVMRQSGLKNYRPTFRAPLYPWIQILGILGCLLLLFEMGTEVLYIVLVLIGVAVSVYWFYGRKRREEESALLYLLEKITAKELTSHSLENELKEIIRERDAIEKDRFDRVIEEAEIVDMEGSISLEKFFRNISEEISKEVDFDADSLYRLLIEREEESTTAITPSIAIPHIIIPGENKFTILIARVRKGIKFSEDAEDVKTVFFLVGSRDERNFHLRALAAIAQIVQEEGFIDRWMKAKNKEELRDIVLLAKRQR